MGKNPDLSQFPFFSGLSKDRLAEIEAFSMVQTLDQGDVVFNSDEPARNLYGLCEGEISLSLLFREKIITKDIKYEEYIRTHVEIFEKPVIIEKVKNKDIFGWSAMVSPERMTATAKCENNCEVVLIPASDLKRIFNRDTELGYILASRVSSIIAQRLNSRTEKLVDTWCSLFESEKVSAV